MKAACLILTLGLLPAAALAQALVVGGDGSPWEGPAVAGAAGVEATEPWALPDPQGAWWVVGATLSPSLIPASALDLSAALAQARQQLDDLEPELARSLLRDAVLALPSAPSAVAAADLRAALELWGQAEQEVGDPEGAHAAYARLLTVAPAHEIQAPPGTGYEVLWGEARRRANQRAAVTGSIQHGGRAWLDGVALEPEASGVLTLAPGAHLLQWQQGEQVRGAWLDVAPDTDECALVAAAYAPALLQRGPADLGAQRALRPWLDTLRGDRPAIVVVQQAAPLSGYTVDDAVTAWASGLEGVARTMATDRVRLVVDGGYALLVEPFTAADGAASLRSSYGAVGLTAGLKVWRFLHARVAGDLAVSQPAQLGGEAETVALLPGFRVGLAVHPERGILQPWAALEGGAWIAPAGRSEDQRKAAADAGVDPGALSLVEGRAPVTPRILAGGGVDLVPAGGPLVVRLGLHGGWSYGFELRATAGVGVRFGR